MKLLGVQCRGADNTDPSSGLPFCSCATVTSQGAGYVFRAPWRFTRARTRMYGGLLSSSLKCCTEDPTLHNYPVTSPLCPSLHKSWGLWSRRGGEWGKRMAKYTVHLVCTPRLPPHPVSKLLWIKLWTWYGGACFGLWSQTALSVGGCFSNPLPHSNKWALVLLTDEGLWEQVPLEWAIDGLRSIWWS